jgi:pimeloyl-ACP methyl ester carboxylesterase
MVHGFMGGSGQWDLQCNEFSKYFNLITVDLPGFGKNAGLDPINTIGGFADWVLETVQAQCVDKFHLLGHSMGGMIVQEMILRAPTKIDKLILYGTGACGALPGRFETIEESKRRAKADGAKQTARRISSTWFLDRTDAPEYEACAEIAEHSTPQAIEAGLDAMQVWDVRDKINTIDAQTLVLWGDGDRTYSWHQTHELWTSIENSNLAVVPNVAHAVHLENPKLFNQITLDFLHP